MARKDLAIFCLLFFTVSFGVAAMAALVPSIAQYFGVEANYALRLTWLYMLPYGVVALFWAPLTRIVTVKKLLLVTTLGFFLSTLFFSWSYTIAQAFVFRFLMGCFGCSFVPITLITIGKTVAPEHKSRYVGIFFGLSYLSTFISVLLSGFLHWKTLYLIPAVLSVAVCILIGKFLTDFDFRRQKFSISYLDTLRDPKALRFFLAIMAGSFLYHSIQQRLGVYLATSFTLPQMAISLIFTIATVSAIFFEFAGGFLCSRIGSIKVTRIGFVMMSVFAATLLVLFVHAPLFVTIILWGSGWALTHVGLSSHLARFPDRILRDASSLNSSLRFSFGGLGAFCGGFLVSYMGFKLFCVLVAAVLFVLGFYLNKLLPERKECYE